MAVPAALLRSLARAAAGPAADLPAATWGPWARAATAEQRLAELQALLQTSPWEMQTEANRVALEEAPDLSEADHRRLVAFLAQVPAMVRRGLRRTSDPAGTTLPSQLDLRHADDLRAFIWSRPPRRRRGEAVWPGSSWVLEECLSVAPGREIWRAQDAVDEAAPPGALHLLFAPGARDRLLAAAADLDRLRRLRPEGVVPLLEAHPAEDPPALLYAHVEGLDLACLIRECRRKRGGMPPGLAGRLLLRLAQVLGAAHRLDPPLVHRALSPYAVLAAVGPGPTTFQVADFGLGALPGREPYASPEQLRGAAPDPRDDVYALGRLGLQMFTGDRQADLDRLPAFERAPGWRDLLVACLAPERADRPADGQALADELLRLLGPARPAAPPPRPPGAAGLLVNGVGLQLVRVPAGRFLRGSPDDEADRLPTEGPRREVTLTRPFWLGRFPVTQREYAAVMGANPAFFTAARGGGPDHPVEQVSWEDAVAFCRKLSALPAEKAAGRVYRLPTEAEWEYACRAGTTTAFAFGPGLASTQANFDGIHPYGGAPEGPSLMRTSPVGAYAPNAWGLYDLHGNVWEWCQDWYDLDYYEGSPPADPPGPAEGGRRVLRGGSWLGGAWYCRAAFRYGEAPTVRNAGIGFRVAVSEAAT